MFSPGFVLERDVTSDDERETISKCNTATMETHKRRLGLSSDDKTGLVQEKLTA